VSPPLFPDDEATPYAQSLRWLYGRTNYEASTPIPYSDEGLKLDRMRELLRRLGRPDAGQRIVHIAGTKGKGSTAAMIAAGLREAGKRVGVYTSPHLERFEERIAIDGEPCSNDELVSLVARVRPIVEQMDREAASAQRGAAGGGPTFFDLSTAMALLHFADRGCDATVLEVGLGGRLDSTNVVTPAVAVITSISLDHTQQLGATRALIAAEKAGIIKPGIQAVSGVADAEAGNVIERIALERGAPFLRADRDFFMGGSLDGALVFYAVGVRIDGIRPAMVGAHQVANAAVALATLGVLDLRGWNIPVEARREGINRARIAARMERFDGDPPVVLDGAHNEASAAALVAALDDVAPGVPPAHRTLVLAISSDKDAPAIVRQLAGAFGRIVVTKYLDNPRALEPLALAAEVRSLAPERVEVVTCGTPAEALNDAAAGVPDAGGVVVVAGSFFLAGEVRRLLVAEGRKPCV
jgi:dihydrofolate synthase/folylpolyglutamate synthase